MSNFGDLVKRLRKEKGLTLEAVAKKIGSHKGYVSGIENDKVNPPSVKIIRKFAKLFVQDEKTLVRIAWADKAPQIIREDAQRILALSDSEGPSSIELAHIPLLNTVASGYSSELAGEGRVKPAVTASIVLPRNRLTPEVAATVCDASMEQQAGPSLSRGDVVLLVREDKIKNGSIVYMVYSMRQKRQAMIRQVMLEQGDHIVLQPINKEFPLEFLTHDDVDAVYRVVGKVEMFESSGVDVKL